MDEEFNNSENATTINQLSSVLSCFIVDENLSDLLIHSIERSLTFPLIRHINLSL